MLKQANLSFSVTAQANGNDTNTIQFSTQDKKTAKLIFTIKEGKEPLNLTDIDGEITLVMQDKSRFVDKTKVTKPLDGIIEYTLTQEQIRHAGRAQGEVVLKARDGSSVGGFRFNFTIKKALMDEDLGPVKDFYIQDLEAVKQDVKKKAEVTASELNNLTTELATIAGNLEEEYQNKAYTVDEKLADVQATVTDLRKNGTGIDAQARQEVEQVTARLVENANNINSQVVNVLFPPSPLQPAKGDGITDDTAAIQAMVNFAKTKRMTVLFPPSTYIIKQLFLAPGVSYTGYGVTIKRPDNAGNWIRTFSVPESGGYLWGSDKDSELLSIKGFTFDGNRANQGEYTNYQLQQSPLLFLSAANQGGRLRVNIDDCTFRDSVSDGISIHRNVDVKISNCVSDNCFRGGVTVHGGNSNVQITNVTCKGDVHKSGVDFEVDSVGYNSSYRTNVTINGMIIDGDFDVAMKDGSVLNGTNIQVYGSPFHIISPNSSVTISNSKFYIGSISGIDNTVITPKDVTFDNCEFIVYNDGTTNVKYAAVRVYFNSGGSTHTNQKINLINCRYKVDSSILETDTTYAIYVEGDNRSDNTLNIIGGSIAKEFTHGIYTVQGVPNLNINGTEINSVTAIRPSFSDGYPLNMEVNNIKIGANVRTYMDFPNSNGKTLISHKNTIIDGTNNVIVSAYSLTLNKFFGGRIIYGDSPPTTSGLIGDIYRLKTPIAGSAYEWICTVSGTTSPTWKVVKTIST